MRSYLVFLILGTLWLLLVLSCINAPIRNLNTSNTNSIPGRSSAAPLPTVKRYKWEPSSFKDEMGRGLIYAMSIESTNKISLDRPYDGTQHATLTIRNHPRYGNDVYISIERGQLLDSDFHSKVLVRFDNDRSMSFSSARPDDLSSDALFLRGAFGVFVRRLKTAKILKIEVPIYQAGNQVFDFDVEGFTWRDIDPK